LEKQRPNLFRLASDTDENDPTGICKFVFLFSLLRGGNAVVYLLVKTTSECIMQQRLDKST